MYIKGSRDIWVRLNLLCFSVIMLLILSKWHGLHRNVSVGQNFNAIEATTQQNSGTRKLSFLVAGVQKAGTTALHDYLLQHPHLSLLKQKESHFFDNETTNWTAPDYMAYESRDRSQAELTIVGEATPIYIYWPTSMKRIRRYNPDMKLIFLFRQPVQRAWSQWKMEYARGSENKSFSWAIREGRARLITYNEMPGYHRVFSYVERGFYGEQLQRVLHVFPREQLLLLLSEDLKAHPTRIIQQVSEFLGVPEFKGEIKKFEPQVSPQPDNVTSLSETDATYLRNVYSDDLKHFAELSGLNITTWFS